MRSYIDENMKKKRLKINPLMNSLVLAKVGPYDPLIVGRRIRRRFSQELKMEEKRIGNFIFSNMGNRKLIEGKMKELEKDITEKQSELDNMSKFHIFKRRELDREIRMKDHYKTRMEAMLEDNEAIGRVIH